jgi:hypothetical protein
MRLFLATVLACGTLAATGLSRASMSLPKGSPENRPDPLTSAARADAPRTLEDAKKKKVMCSYFVYGDERYICGDPPLEDVKKACNKKATEERGEKAECTCTMDQGYIQNARD